jgi:hypothetical protein
MVVVFPLPGMPRIRLKFSVIMHLTNGKRSKSRIRSMETIVADTDHSGIRNSFDIWIRIQDKFLPNPRSQFQPIFLRAY